MDVIVPVVKATWGNTTSHIEYYSEVEDTDIPTVDLGVPNTERGKSLLYKMGTYTTIRSID